MKAIQGVYDAPPLHWVGDGFPVRSLFSYRNHGKQLSPFLLLDYAGPADFVPAERPRGVGQHPHRGFETVTIVYHGEVAHRDSTGQGGVIVKDKLRTKTFRTGCAVPTGKERQRYASGLGGLGIHLAVTDEQRSGQSQLLLCRQEGRRMRFAFRQAVAANYHLEDRIQREMAEDRPSGAERLVGADRKTVTGVDQVIQC